VHELQQITEADMSQGGHWAGSRGWGSVVTPQVRGDYARVPPSTSAEQALPRSCWTRSSEITKFADDPKLFWAVKYHVDGEELKKNRIKLRRQRLQELLWR